MSGSVGRAASPAPQPAKARTEHVYFFYNTPPAPFTLFGFMELDQPRSLVFENLGVRLKVTLKSDRMELQAVREAEQLELPLDLTVDANGEPTN